MRAAALRRQEDGRTYVRITEYLTPLVTVVPVGRAHRNDGSMFVLGATPRCRQPARRQSRPYPPS